MTYLIRSQILRSQVLLMLVLALAAPAPSQTQGGVDILLAKARSLELRGRIDLAAENWRKVLLVNPNQTEALAGLARASKENGQTGEEHSYLDRLRKVNPNDPGISAVEKLHVFTPEERSRLDEAGRLAMQHKPDEAMKVYREVLGGQQPPPGKWAQPFYETEAASTGGREKAISQLRQLGAQFPKQEAYRLWLASLMTYDPKTRMEGLQILESIKDPTTAEQARAPWRQALLWEKQDLEVLSSMEAYLSRYPDPELQPIVTELHAKQEQNVADANKAMAFKALRNKDIETAAAQFSAVLRQSPNDANALIGLGYARLDQKRFSEALDLFDHARTFAPQRQDARDGYNTAKFSLAMQRGAGAQQQNRSEEAVLAYRDALTLRPLDTGAQLGLANALLRERKFAEAESRFQQVLNQSPNNADAMAGLGFVRLNEGRFDDAAKLLANAHKLDPARKDVDQEYSNAKFWDFVNHGAAALSQNRFSDASAAYEQALQLNPNNKDALLGLANASMRGGDFRAAAKTFYRLTAADPSDASNWMGLIKAQVGEKAPEAAIATSQHIPPAVKQKMEARSDYLSELALVYFEANQPAFGEQILRRALAAAGRSDSEDALALRLDIASMFMNQGKTGQAIEIYREATQSHPADAGAWEALVGAYTRLGEFPEAINAVRSMPQSSYDAAVKHSGFLDSVAVLYSTQGECVEAADLLHRSLALDQSQGHQPTESTELQLADILMREGDFSEARSIYSILTTRDMNSPDAWRGYLVVLHKQRADRTLIEEVPNIPPAVRAQLETDPSFLILEASAYSESGRKQDALQLLQRARSSYTAQRQLPPVVLDMQTAWIMLDVSIDEPGLSDLLLYDKGRRDLTAKQRETFEQIYSEWSVRRAERAFETKPELAFSILTEAGQEYPGDRNIHAALASLYLKRHDKQKALDLFQSWGMKGAQPGDYRVAAGAALSAHKFDLADQFLRRGLERYPHDPELMHMAARQEIARGDYDEGERELRSAMMEMREQNNSSVPAAIPSAVDVESHAEGEKSLSTRDDSNVSTSAASACKPEARHDAGNEARIRPISLVIFGAHGRPTFAQIAASQETQQSQPPEHPQQQPQPSEANQQPQQPEQPQPQQSQPQQQPQVHQMEEEVESVDNRNTPMILTGGVGTGRVGDPGVDRLIISDTVLGSGYTVSDQVRFGIEGHGVFASSGTSDGSSNLMFGTLPAYARFGEQSKIGYSGLAQLSTNTFGMAFGTSPQGFAVHNLIGGIRYRPLNGWFTVLGQRDSVKDSLLSYAGARDPGKGIRWGGVVSNTGTVRIESAPSTYMLRYKTIGEYASGSFSFVQGVHVPDNWSVSGNAGLYWQIVQGLTIGVNGDAMHYDKNLKYFSFGQGGYFSPQQFYLGSVPVSWYSRHPRFEYQVRFSGGVQYLHENATAFYPVLPGSAKVKQGIYAANNSAAPNYDADIRMGYRVAPHVYLDTFATANNARDYYTQSIGFSLKFLFDRIPTSTDLPVNSIPDWTGRQPFSVQ